MITDTEIQENVLAELSWEPALDATEITVTANNGVVTLRGKVHHYGERRAAEQAAVKIKGVKSLINELQVTLCGEEQPSDEEIADEILRLEDEGIIEDYYEEIVNIEESYDGHKVGGYPGFCQPGISFGADYEFAIQISSDEKAHINIVDNGNIYLSKNIKTGEWKFYCDFY